MLDNPEIRCLQLMGRQVCVLLHALISRAGQNTKTNVTDNLGANSISLHFLSVPRKGIN